MIDPIDFLRVTGVGMDWIMCLPLYKCLQPGDCDMPIGISGTFLIPKDGTLLTDFE